MTQKKQHGEITPLHLVQDGKRPAMPDELGTHYYINASVNNPVGSQLLDLNNRPLRASRVRVYCPRVSWHFSHKANSLIETPTGNGKTSGGGWQYPGTPEYGVVLFQPGGLREAISATSGANAQEFQLSNAADIMTNVNDSGDDVYDDNGGAYDLVVQVLQA